MKRSALPVLFLLAQLLTVVPAAVAPVISDGAIGPAGMMWIARDSNRSWFDVASSSDGSHLVAVVQFGNIYTSADSGLTWTARAGGGKWWTVASSDDGTKLAAAINGSNVFTSTDSGANWIRRDSGRAWNTICSSSDGTKLAAITGDQLYTSIDSGVSWTPRMSNPGTGQYWRCVASSSDGTKLLGVVNNGHIYTSTDSGITWTARDSVRNWHTCASSSDGTKLVAGVNGGQIYTSSDSGVTWTARAQNKVWYGLSSSADGTKLLGMAFNDYAYLSTDSGVTWTPQDSPRKWFACGSSADGAKLVAVVNTGKIYTSVPARVIAVTMSQDSNPTPFNLTLNASDADMDILTWSIYRTANNGTATASGTGDSKVIGYTPTAGFYGKDSFIVQVSDGALTDLILVDVTVEPATYAVTYDANGATGGTIPSPQEKINGTDLMLATNSGGLVKTGSQFIGWNTAADGTGTVYAEGSTYTINTAVTLYADWQINSGSGSSDGNSSSCGFGGGVGVLFGVLFLGLRFRRAYFYR